MNRIHSRRMDTSFFHTKFPTTSRAEGAVSSANTGMLPFTGSSQLQQQQTSNYPRPPRATDDPSRHSTVSAAPVGGRPDLATVETTARGPLHPLRGAAPDQKRCTAYGSGAAHPITRTNAESARREPGCGTRGRRQGLAGLRGYAPSEARGADGSRAGRRPRAHKAARPGTTARGPLHPLRAAAPDQKGCTAYGSGAAPRITRTNAESARRGPGCGARGRRLGLAGQRVDAPSEARGADGERAGRRPRARQAARPSAAAQPQLSRHSTSRRRGHPRR